MFSRLSALSGLAFVACFAAAAALYGSGAGDRSAEIAAYYADQGDRMRQIAGFAVLLAGCVFLLVYVGRLCRSSGAGHAVVGSGIAATALLALANALWAASAFTVESEPGYRIDPRTHLLFEEAGFLVLVSAAALAIPFAVGIALRTRRGAGLPRWFGWLGGLTAVGLATAYWYVPLAVFLACIGCGSVLLALQDSRR
ncbi:MAG TPA: hypothetical protein VFU30_08935 [Gaiellaceae bacterium]|nr:hypothetical protein [Gaiellaceae bacterium]